MQEKLSLGSWLPLVHVSSCVYIKGDQCVRVWGHIKLRAPLSAARVALTLSVFTFRWLGTPAPCSFQGSLDFAFLWHWIRAILRSLMTWLSIPPLSSCQHSSASQHLLLNTNVFSPRVQREGVAFSSQQHLGTPFWLDQLRSCHPAASPVIVGERVRVFMHWLATVYIPYLTHFWLIQSLKVGKIKLRNFRHS